MKKENVKLYNENSAKEVTSNEDILMELIRELREVEKICKARKESENKNELLNRIEKIEMLEVFPFIGEVIRESILK